MTSFAVKSNGMSNSQQMPPTTTSYFNPLYAQDLNENSNTGANGCNGGNKNYLKAPESNVAASSSSYSNQNLPVTKATENGVDSFQMAKNKFSGTDLANYNGNNKPNRGGAGGCSGGGGVLPTDPLVSGVTRIYINHVSSSNNVSEKIKDVNQKTTLKSSGNSLIKLTQDSNSNAGKVEIYKKDNSTSPIKIYASSTSSSRLESNENKKELKTNYSDFDLIAQPRTQDAFTQIELSQIAETGVQKTLIKPNVNENSSGNYQDTQKEEFKTNMNVTKQVEFKNDMHGQLEKKSKIHLEKSKTVIVNVTPQKQDNETVEALAAVETAAAAASESQTQSDSKYPSSRLVSNLKKLMDFKAATTSNDSVTTQNLSSNTNAKEVYVDESKYDIKNDSTPVSITSNVNKPNKQVTIAPAASTSTTNTNTMINNNNNNVNAMDRMNSDSHILPQMRVNNYNGNSNIPLNQNIFPTQSSSYYNDVNNRNPMTASQEGGINDIGTRAGDNHLSSEVMLVHDETKSSSNQSYTRNPFMENQITNQFESDTTNNAAPITHNPVMTFYNGSKVWTTTISNDGTTPNVIDNQKVERVTEKSKHTTGEQPATAPPSAKVKESNLQKSRSNSMRKNLKVKIKLPIENMAKIPPKKERKIQKCCLVLFLLILFILATGILIYFFASGFIMKRTAL